MSRIGKLLLLVVLIVAGSQSAFAQQALRGTVVDESGLSIIGANLLIKGTTNGTITDMDGGFTIPDVKKGDVLEVSYIGYQAQEFTVTSFDMHIVLKEDLQQLNEVVVVGYGVQKKSSLTGSIASVKADDMENRTTNSVSQALQGKAAGVQLFTTSAAPGEAGSIQIRGFSSNGSSDPLYVVDGLRVSSIGQLDPNSIESIEILKDAASAAIYGAEAGNGVIMITTKKGTGKKSVVTYDFMYTAESLAKKPEVMNAAQYAEYMTEGFGMGEYISKYWDGVTDTDWSKVGFETGSMMRHNLSFANSTDKNNIYLAFSHLSNDGIVTGNQDTYKRLTLTVNADVKIKDWLTIGTTNNMYRASSKTGSTGSGVSGSVFSDVIMMDPLTPVYMTYDELPEEAQTNIDNGLTYLTGSNGKYYGISKVTPQSLAQINPLVHALGGTGGVKGRDYGLDGTLYANITPFKGFTFTSRLGYKYANTYSREWSNIYYYNTLNSATDNSVTQSQESTFYFQWENFINYTFDIKKDHHFTVMLGQSYSKQEANSVTAYTQSVTQDLDNFKYLDYATDDGTKTVSGTDGITSVKMSYYGRINYDFKDRYMLQFSLRADAADLSQLPQEKRWGYFPAVSVGWDVMKESWFPKVNGWDYFKIRASWGQNGSLSNLSDFSWASAISTSASYPYTTSVSYTNASSPSALGNTNLKWETSEQLDLGIDLRFLRNRLTISGDYFIKKTKDLIMSDVNLSLTSGNTASPINAGNVENKGFELEVSWRDKIGDLSYSISGNLATLKNEVTSMPSSISRITVDGTSNAYQTCFEVGYPVWYLRGYRYTGVDENGDPTFKDVNGNGVFDSDDYEMIGSGIPDVTYGLTLNLAYKGFDFTAFGQGAAGFDVMYTLTNIDRVGANRLELFYENRWTEDNTSAPWPKAGSDLESYFMKSSAMVFSGNYFKIKQLQLGYSLPEKALKKIGIGRLRVYASLDDFFTFTSYPGMDPSVCGSTGVDNGTFPTSKKVVFGANLTF